MVISKGIQTKWRAGIYPRPQTLENPYVGADAHIGPLENVTFFCKCMEYVNPGAMWASPPTNYISFKI